MEAQVKKNLVSLAIIIVLVISRSSCAAVSMETNSSSSIIADDGDSEFLMDSHSSRYLQSAGSPAQNSLVASNPAANCGRGNPYGGCTPNLNNNKIGEHCVYQGANRSCRSR
ncbi:hypothetical protein HRI_005280800 [Hibiscus trionum]|uniref:Uncharacterized protein n=1 Tax=Hibiscus trionum TaxID=183268 RepID=A0A9W7JIA1_HIBTR|nr:hypothetical protein HRI_005280800 [Hibiscus trionum]